MQAVVLAAGEGTRLRPLTADRPKPLVEVAGRPILSWGFDRLLALGVDKLVVVVGYRGERIRERYGDAYRGVPVEYAVQDERLGVAHALARAESLVDGPFLYLHGDNVLDPAADLGAVPRLLGTGDGDGDEDRAGKRAGTGGGGGAGADAVLTVERVSRERATETGVVVTGRKGVERLVEKPDDPPSRLAITGFHGFSPAVFESCRAIEPSDRGEYELPAAITHLVGTGGRVETVPFEGWRVAVDRPEDRRRAERLIREGPDD